MINDLNISKSLEQSRKEKEACRSLFDTYFKPRIEEMAKAQDECVDILRDFLEENNLSMDELVDYIRSDCSDYDLEYLRNVYELLETVLIEEDLLRDYYDSVLDDETLSLLESAF